MEELDFELSASLDTIVPQIGGTLALIKSEDWSEIALAEERAIIHALHESLTKRNLAFALDIQKLAVSKNQHNFEQVSSVISKLNEFYVIYKQRYNRYLVSQDEKLRLLLESKEKTTKLKRNKNGRVVLSAADTEAKFQTELTKSMLELSKMSRQLADLDNPDKITVLTHGDVPIPLAMQESVESLFPSVRNFLERRDNEALKTPDSPD